jgi:serine/threonine-protein kinase HipA
MRKLQVRFTRSPGEETLVGTLAEQRGRVYFEYAPDFLNTGLNLSPFRLPFEASLFEHSDSAFGPLPGLFDDSLPDGWGLLLMDRHFRQIGLRLDAVSPLDRLSWLGTRTMGALTYFPPQEMKDVEASVFDLHDLARQSQDILSGQAAEVLPQLMQAGGSPGGARPKVLIGFEPASGQILSGADDLPDGFEHWIVKFSARLDVCDAGPIEYAYSLMARSAGIQMPPTRLFETAEGDRFFGVKRFDRETNRRFHVRTFGNLIQANFRIPSSDYGDLLKATSVLTRNQADVLRIFRQMVFNVLAHNRDDHVKNFAFLMDASTGEWALSPAYDLTYSSGPGGEHSMTLAGEGRDPSREQMLRLAEQASLSPREAKTVIEEVAEGVAQWSVFANQASVSEEGLRKVSHDLLKFTR